MPSSSDRTRWYVTGFEPFGGHPTNPSIEVARACAGRLEAAGQRAQAEVLPVTFELARGWARGRDLGEGARVIHVGLAARRAHTSLEERARNRIGATADNDGVVQPGRLQQRGPGARRTGLDVGRLREALQVRCQVRELPEVRPSEDAGEYVCNAIYYHTLGCVPAGAALFVHVPWLEPGRAAALGEALAEALLEVEEGG